MVIGQETNTFLEDGVHGSYCNILTFNQVNIQKSQTGVLTHSKTRLDVFVLFIIDINERKTTPSAIHLYVVEMFFTLCQSLSLVAKPLCNRSMFST
jgi:hypothetical protein